jgi:hypothetical protein
MEDARQILRDCIYASMGRNSHVTAIGKGEVTAAGATR